MKRRAWLVVDRDGDLWCGEADEKQAEHVRLTRHTLYPEHRPFTVIGPIEYDWPVADEAKEGAATTSRTGGWVTVTRRAANDDMSLDGYGSALRAAVSNAIKAWKSVTKPRRSK